MRVQFWGVRGSIPTPLRPKEVEDKVIRMAEDVVRAGITNPDDVAGYLREQHSSLIRGTVGGNTACVSVDWPGGLVIFDAGSGIRVLGEHLKFGPYANAGAEIHIFLSHTHWDHIQGLPFFAPLFQRNTVHLHSCHEDLEKRLRLQQHEDFFPTSLDIFLSNLVFHYHEENEIVELHDGVRVITKRLNHPGDSYGFRLEQNGHVVVYATDNEHRPGHKAADAEMVKFFRDADLVIFDSQYTLEESMLKEDWGHSSAIVGVDLAAKAGVKKLALFHHEPSYPDSFIRNLLLKAQTYRDANYNGIDLQLMVAAEESSVVI